MTYSENIQDMDFPIDAQREFYDFLRSKKPPSHRAGNRRIERLRGLLLTGEGTIVVTKRMKKLVASQLYELGI